MSTPGILLQPTTESDRTYIYRLNFLTEVFGEETAEISENFSEDLHFYVKSWAPDRGGFIAWDSQGIPAGGVWLLWGAENDHGYGFVAPDIPELAIAVEPRFRGQGAGSLLINAAIKQARELGAPGVSLCVDDDNPRALKLYRRLGFVDVRHDDEWGVSILVHRFPAENTPN